MFEHETFRDAPIAEAAVDFSVGFDKPLNFGDLAQFGKAAAQVFTRSRERRMFTTSLEMVNDEPIFHNTEHRFLAFSSEDERYVAQVRPNGFGFSRLRPYISWSDFSSRALSAWSIYNKTFKPNAITGISLKYVNRIELPVPINFDQYFHTTIQIAPDIPQEVSEAFFAFALRDEIGNAGRVVFAIDEPTTNKEKTSLVFNVEAVHEGETPLPAESAKIADVLSHLRDLKNRLFFSSITEDLRRTFR